jgi:hypothetical protein
VSDKISVVGLDLPAGLIHRLLVDYAYVR